MRCRRVSAIALVIGLMALPMAAEAKKGKPAPKPPSTVQVTIEMIGDGLATTCTGALTMDRENATMLRLDWVPSGEAIEAHLPVTWMRSHPISTGGYPFTGCHGGLLRPDSDEGFGGYFILSGDGDGIELSSRFDYYWDYGTKGRRMIQEVLEFLEIGATLTRTDHQAFDWSASGIPQEVEGGMELRRFEKLADGTGAGWESFGTVPVEMVITIASSG